MSGKQLIIIEDLDGSKKIDLDRIHRVFDLAIFGLDDLSVNFAPVYYRNNIFLLQIQQEALCETYHQASIIAIIYRALSAVRDAGNEVITQLLLTYGHVTRAPPHESHFM